MIWKDIEGYEGRYQVSDTGLIKSCEHYHPTMIKGTPVMRHKKEQLLKQWKRSSYFFIDLWKDGKRDIRSVHVLVYETFNGPLKDNEVVTAVWDSVNECFYESETKKEVDSRDIAEWWKDI